MIQALPREFIVKAEILEIAQIPDLPVVSPLSQISIERYLGENDFNEFSQDIPNEESQTNFIQDLTKRVSSFCSSEDSDKLSLNKIRVSFEDVSQLA